MQTRSSTLPAAMMSTQHANQTEDSPIEQKVLPPLTMVVFSIRQVMEGTRLAWGEPAYTKGEEPLKAAGQDKAKPAFKEEDIPVFEDMIDG